MFSSIDASMFEKNNSENSSIKEKVTNDRENAIQQLNTTLKKQVKYLYTIQLSTFPLANVKSIQKQFNNLPDNIKSEAFIYPVGKYLTIKYSATENKKEIQKKLAFAKESGIRDSFIIRIPEEKYKKLVTNSNNVQNNIQKEEVPTTDKDTPLWCIQQQSIPMIKLDNYEYSRALTDAHKYKKQNFTLKSIETYEKLFAHDPANKAIVNNLFYLYGKTNNWPKAKEKFCLLKRKDMAAYSYAVGALEINNPMLEEELESQLQYDRSGYIHLALGVYFERNEQFKQSHKFYKRAYDLNRYDLYLAFAYARSCEIESQYKKAIFIYNLISQSNNKKYENLIHQAYNRYKQLEKLNISKKRKSYGTKETTFR